MPFSEHSIYFAANKQLREELEKDPVLNYNLYWIKPDTLKGVTLPEEGLLVVRNIMRPDRIYSPHSIPWDAIWSSERYNPRFPKELLCEEYPPERMLERILELVLKCNSKAFYFSIKMHGGDILHEHSWIFGENHTVILNNENADLRIERKAYINAEEVTLYDDTLYLSLKEIGVEAAESGWFEPHTSSFVWRAIRLSPTIKSKPELPAFPTSLYRSATLGDLESVNKCIEAGISPLDYSNLLDVAIASGNAQLVQRLIDENVEVKNSDDDYSWGCSLNHAKNKETIEILLKHGANVNHRSNPITRIAESGNEEAVRYMIEQGAELVLNERQELWFAACKGGMLFLVQELFAKTDPEALSYEGTGITVAAAHNRLDVVKWLVEKGVTVSDDTLIQASKNGSIETIEWLLNTTSLAVNAITEFGDTALSEAIKNEQIETVNCLLSHGADPLLQYGYYGFSAIHTACFAGNLAIVERLLSAGASIDCIANDRRTPLFIAVDTENQELVNFLLKKGAVIPDWKIEHYQTIREVAKRKKITLRKTEQH